MFENFEIFGVVAIVCLQLYFFGLTLYRVSEYKNILLRRRFFKITKVLIPLDVLDNVDPKIILSNLSKYPNKDDELAYNPESKIEISLIATENSDSDISSGIIYSLKNISKNLSDRFNDLLVKFLGFKPKSKDSINFMYILESLNVYLIRNRSAVADFNLMKDIVERTDETVEDEINSTISVPLYLGLLGTLLGIIFGLFNISDLPATSDPNQSSAILDESIKVLLGGVKIAMVASFTGLALTVLNSGMFFRKAKTKLRRKKNDFYSFIQAELLPALNQSVNSSLSSLQHNLHKFNEDFTVNINKLGGLLNKNHDALIAQEKILTSLERVDINEFAKANVKVLKELQKSTDSFGTFNLYIDHINDALLGTSNIVTKINDLLKRTDNLDQVAVKIISTFEENKKLLGFLQSHYSSLDESKQMISDSVGTVSDILDKALNQLKEFTMSKINEVKELTLKEIDLMENKYPEKWKKLDNLSHLEKISASINEIKLSNAGQIGSLKEELKEINENLLNTVAELEEIKNSDVTYNIKKRLRNWKLFRKNGINEN